MTAVERRAHEELRLAYAGYLRAATYAHAGNTGSWSIVAAERRDMVDRLVYIISGQVRP